MSESMFGKRERLYADARKAENPEPAKEETVAQRLTAVPPSEPLVPPTPPRRPQKVEPPVAQERPRPEGWRATASTSLELGGIALVSVGGFLIAPWLGCVVLGVLLIVLGVAIGYGA